MKKRYLFAALLIACGWVPAAHAEDNTIAHVVIAAVQTGQEGAQGNDFVAIHNKADDALNITGWRVQYRAANATGSSGWATKRTIACVEAAAGCTVTLPAGGTLLIGTYSPPGVVVQPMASGFSDVGGQIRLVDVGQAVVDMVGYGTAAEFEGAAAPAPLSGRVILRTQTNGKLTDTGNNSTDFTVGCLDLEFIGVLKLASCDPIVEDTDDEDEVVVEPPVHEVDTPVPPQMYALLVITELLPDPESPATDTADEFIELHNPNDEPVNLAGYAVRAGADFKDSYTFGDVVIPAGGYMAFMSSTTRISLTNSGTAVQLLNPAGELIDTVSSYGQAKSGKTWAKHPDGNWQWAAPTPHATNIFTADVAPAVLAAATAIKKATTAKKAAATSTAKPKAPKAAAAPSTKVAAKAPPASTAQSAPQASGPVPYIILGVVGLGVMGYAIYEYRQDIARMVRRIKAALFGRKTASEPTLQTD